MINKQNKILEDQQNVRVKKLYTEAIKLREQAIEANTNKSLKERFKQL